MFRAERESAQNHMGIDVFTHRLENYGYRIDPHLDGITLKTRWISPDSDPMRRLSAENLMELGVTAYFLATYITGDMVYMVSSYDNKSAIILWALRLRQEHKLQHPSLHLLVKEWPQ